MPERENVESVQGQAGSPSIPPPRNKAKPACPRSLADHVRAIVQSRGLSPTDLAAAAGIAPSQTSRFLAGKRELSLDAFGRVAQALGLALVETKGGLRGDPNLLGRNR